MSEADNRCPLTEAELDMQLTAYLDGELEPDEVQAVEHRLANDPDYLQRMQRLQKSWDLLDSLPRRHTDASFTRSTLEMVVKSAVGDEQKRQAKWKRWGARIALLMLIPLMVGAASFYIARRSQRRPVEQFAQDLPIIENLDMYEKVDSVEFLSLLEEQGIFQDDDAFLEQELDSE